MNNLEPVTCHRTQLYLPASLYWKVKAKTKEENISFAEFMRQLIKKELEIKEKARERTKEKSWGRFLAAAGIGKGPKDLSYNHDKYFEA